MPNPLTSALRLQDWWAPKLPVLLAVAYAGLAHRGSDWAFSDLLFPLASVIVGAAYVSLINDYCDLEADRLAAKANRMAAIKPALRLPLLIAVVIIGAGFCVSLLPHPHALAAYVAAWLAFTAYSAPPLRLKARGLFGVIADAAGAHVFPAIYLYAITSNLASTSDETARLDIAVIALWSLALGIRGNLWHQLGDRDSDRKAGTRTFGASINAINKATAWAPILLAFELGSLGFLVVRWEITQIIFFMPVYFFIIWARRRIWRIATSALFPKRRTRFLCAEIYSTVLPWILLLELAAGRPEGWAYITLHVLLFAKSDLKTLIECSRLLADRRVYRAAIKDAKSFLVRLGP